MIIKLRVGVTERLSNGVKINMHISRFIGRFVPKIVPGCSVINMDLGLRRPAPSHDVFCAKGKSEITENPVRDNLLEQQLWSWLRSQSI